ncbi:MAG: tRNA (N6-threonylcarbamoyladenosine(37)-N6)-methyltransferase TrmO [Propionibacteriaceae bacterium]|nr:tRNA (N6-threonylcarbamoyladenosine(37)-N6)-methyltransferase TrmO [Propionibacteriaceae bacterium]
MHHTHAVHSIGVVHTSFHTKAEAPIQGAFVPDAEGVLEVHEEFEDGLDDIEGFSHLILIYVFDRGGEVDLRPVPFLDDRPHGVFATRNPRRPNRLGLTVVRLLRREGRRLIIKGVDILDGTPVVDIKPYVPRFDSVPEALEGWFSGREARPKPVGRE